MYQHNFVRISDLIHDGIHYASRHVCIALKFDEIEGEIIVRLYSDLSVVLVEDMSLFCINYKYKI